MTAAALGLSRYSIRPIPETNRDATGSGNARIIGRTTFRKLLRMLSPRRSIDDSPSSQPAIDVVKSVADAPQGRMARYCGPFPASQDSSPGRRRGTSLAQHPPR